MSFILGLDVGTATGAGATKRDGRVQPCALGDHTATLPSVVVLHDDGSTLVGEEAERIAGLELTRVARDARLDPAQQMAPIVVGGQVHTPHELLRTLYSTMVERVCFSHNAAPTHVVLTHPAVPEGMRCDMVERIADELFPGSLVVPEPIAAAVKLACDGSLPSDCVIAVYDFGGGTYDATLVRRDGDRFSIVGEPSGMPTFGGIDVDDLVLDYVNRALDGAITRLDLGSPEAMAALTRLRFECRDAKERLSYETEVSIDASLPNSPALVQLTRADFDDFLLPSLESSVDVLERTITDAGMQPGDVDAVALVGGSSRIPLVADLLGARTRIPILVDPYPELTVALGAAQMVDDETPNSSVFPFAELALPSLTAFAGAGAVGLLTPSGGEAASAATQIGEAVGKARPGPAAAAGAAIGAESDNIDEFEALMQRGHDLDATATGRLVGAAAGRMGDRATTPGLNPKIGAGALAGLIGLLLVAVLTLGGGGGDNDKADDSTRTGNESASPATNNGSTTSSSSSTSSPGGDNGEDPGATPPTSDEDDPPRTTTTSRETTTTDPGTTTTTRPGTTSTSRPTTTTTSTTTSTTTTTTTSTTTPTTSTTTTTTAPSPTSSSSSTSTSSTSSTEPSPNLQPTFRSDQGGR